LIKTKGFYFM